MTTHTTVREPMTDVETRPRISLDGTWSFKHAQHPDWTTITVPLPWQAAFDDLRDVAGRAAYSREFAVPEEWKGRTLVLAFGAVGYFCTVFLNGHEVGSHEGSYLPFEIVLPADCLLDLNKLEVLVVAPTGDAAEYPEFPFSEIPHGKQSWYGMLGGIWQSVFLEARHRSHIRHVDVTPNLEAGTVGFCADLSPRDATRLSARVFDGSGVQVAAADFQIGKDTAAFEGSVVVEGALPWSPDTPNLYRFEVSLRSDGMLLDSVGKTIGFRTFETRGGQFFLNGKPFYLRGALDQDYYPRTISTPPSLEFLEDQFGKAKALGLNCIRMHIKVPDPRYYDVADKLGMTIWADLPNVEIFSPKSSQRLLDTMEGMVKRDRHHPSIIIWTIINEDWGTRVREEPQHRQWLLKTVDWLKALDPTRLVVDNSACGPNYHVKTDINDYHYYRTVPELRSEWDALTNEFANSAGWTYSPHGDAVRSGDEPLVVSEFGVWGLPHIADLVDDEGNEPWWFETGVGQSDGVAYPHGMLSRFNGFRLGRVFGTLDDFAEAAQWYQYQNFKYEVESLRAEASIAGYVVTELTDVHWEPNGLMDMERNLRVFSDRFSSFNTDIVIVPKVERFSWWCGEAMPVSLSVAAGGRSVGGGTLSWTIAGLDDGGSVEVPEVAPLQVLKLPPLGISLPDVDRARMLEVVFELTDRQGTCVSRNSLALAVHPKRTKPAVSVSIASDDENVRGHFAGLGYAILGTEDADIFVTRNLDERRIDEIRLGRKVLLLAEHATNGYLRTDAPPREPPGLKLHDETPGIPSPPYFSFPGHGLVDRRGTMWNGDWVTTFSWLARTGPYAALPGGPMMDLTFDRVVPRAVMTGFRPWEFDARVKSGVVAGWIHKAAATILEKPYGDGMLLATTYRLLEDRPGFDPTATVLLEALLSDLASHG
ncbi:hypothetical protein ASG25_09385 [Rhizobium sp. Leaf384]|nr:hypothetical protein ASG25_09385 [Rhizobium sp. Leaf384]